MMSLSLVKVSTDQFPMEVGIVLLSLWCPEENDFGALL